MIARIYPIAVSPDIEFRHRIDYSVRRENIVNMIFTVLLLVHIESWFVFVPEVGTDHRMIDAS